MIVGRRTGVPAPERFDAEFDSALWQDYDAALNRIRSIVDQKQ